VQALRRWLPLRIEQADGVLGVEEQPQTAGQLGLDVGLRVGFGRQVDPQLP